MEQLNKAGEDVVYSGKVVETHEAITVDNAIIAEVTTPSKKERKRSETKTLYGANALRELSVRVSKSLNESIEFNERVTKIAEALNIPSKAARDMLKNTEGMADTYSLRKFVRGSFMRSDLCADSLKLCRIANFIAEQIGEANEVITRAALKTQAEQENSPE